MKIIHCADFHLDSKMEGLPAEKAKIRREELFLNFERVVEYAKENSVTAVIIAGDLFDGQKILLKSQKRIMHVVAKCPSVDFLYLSGNHEKDGFLDGQADFPKNLKVFGSWGAFEYGKIKIYGKNGGADLSVYQKNFNGEDVNILAMHGQVVTHAGVIKEDEISLPLLRNKGIDYLALGHVHKAVEGRLDGRGVYAYSGCPEGRGFDETGDKGFIELTVNGKNVSYKFIPFAKRKIYEIEVPCDSFENWFECRDFAINKVQNDVEISGLVKLVFVGKRNGFEIDKIGVEKLLQDACFYAKIVDKTDACINGADFVSDFSPIGVFVKSVLESDIENLTKNRVIMCGIKALKGEEI